MSSKDSENLAKSLCARGQGQYDTVMEMTVWAEEQLQKRAHSLKCRRSKLYHPKKKPVLVELSVYTSGRALLVLQGFTATDARIQMFFSGKALHICVH